MDDRVDMYPTTVVDDFLTVLRGRPGWQQVLDRDGVDVVVWDADEPLTSLLAADPDWRIPYNDSRFVVACRRDSTALAEAARAAPSPAEPGGNDTTIREIGGPGAARSAEPGREAEPVETDSAPRLRCSSQGISRRRSRSPMTIGTSSAGLLLEVRHGRDANDGDQRNEERSTRRATPLHPHRTAGRPCLVPKRTSEAPFLGGPPRKRVGAGIAARPDH